MDGKSCRVLLGPLFGVLLVVVCFHVIGCGTANVYTDVASRYPDELYLTGVGVSGESQEEAENRARAAVAARVRSSLESEIEAVAKSVTVDGRTTDAQATMQRIKIQAEFKHGELIHVDRESWGMRDDGYQAVAYLSRREAGRVLEGDYAMASAALQRGANSLEAVGEADVPAFTSGFQAAHEAFVDLARSEAEYRAIVGVSQRGYALDRELWLRLQQRRQSLLDGLRVGLSLRLPAIQDDTVDVTRLAHVFDQALEDLGLNTRGQSCEEVEYWLDLHPVVTYQGIIGIVCRLSFTGQLRECRGGGIWELHLVGTGFTGNGTSEYAARRAAEQTVTAVALAPILAEALHHVLPVE